MSNNNSTEVVSQEPIHGIPEEILARNRTKFYAMVDFLGGVIREEGRGFRATCPACNRDTLHVRRTPDGRVSVYCRYCGGSEPRRVLKENGFDIPAPGPVVIDHGEIKQTWDRWRSQGVRPIEGTPADTYLASRAIDIRAFKAGTFRHLQCGYGWYDKRFVCPAMIGWTYSLFGGETYKPAAVHVTFLRRDGSGKADVPVPKRTFGPTSGAAVYFKPPDIKHPEDCEWVIAEGVETTLSAMLLFQERGRGLAGIAALSAVGVQYLQLPRSIKRVIIAADNDDNKDGIGERVARALRYRLWSQGKIVSIAVPPKPGQDWNDVLGAGSEVAR